MNRPLFIFFSILTFFLFGFQLFAQSPIHENIIPPSPQASDLGKYSELETNLHLGSPNISIPIYTIQGKDLNHDISLRYDATGRKVSEVASWVGLGWTLQAGGVITRTVRGLPDDHQSNGYFAKYPVWDGYRDDLLPNGTVTDPSTPEYNFLENCYNQAYDLMPDAYNFNFDGYNGRILFDGITQEPMIIPHQDLEIRHHPYGDSNPSDVRWEIITPEGSVYTFGSSGVETSTAGGSGSYETSWNLTQIENFNGSEKMVFAYENGGDSFSVTNYQVNTIQYQKTSAAEGGGGCSNPSPPNHPVYDTQETTFNLRFLQNIWVYRNGELSQLVEFESDNIRLDKTGFTGKLKKLNQILIADKDLQIIKGVSFQHSYFGSGTNLRLRLDSLTETSKNPYTFEYLGGSMLEYENKGIDHWGYPNGATGNQTLIPKTPAVYLASGTHFDNINASANRSPTLSGAQTYLLNKITYPTGGSATYTYEVHNDPTYIDSELNYGPKIVKAYSDAPTTSDPSSGHQPMNILEGSISSRFGVGDAFDPNNLPNVRASKITLLDDQYVDFNLVITTPSGAPASTPAGGYLFDSPLPTKWDESIPIPFGVPLFLGAGDYYIAAVAQTDVPGLTVTLSASYFQLVPPYTKNVITGGARVKSAILSPDATATSEDILYEYFYLEDYHGNLQGIGVAPDIIDDTEPNTIINKYDEVDLRPTSLNTHYSPTYFELKGCNDLIASAYNIDPFARTSGHHIGYGEVTVVKNKMRDGMTVYKYNNSRNNARLRGKLLSEEVYAYDITNDELVKEKETTYQYGSHYYGKSVEGVIIDVVGTTPTINQNTNIYGLNANTSLFEYGTSFNPLKKKIETSFSEGLSNSLVFDYHYDFAENPSLVEFGEELTQVTREFTTTSAGDSRFKYYYYPHSYSGPVKLRNDHYTNFLISEAEGVIDDGEYYLTRHYSKTPVSQGNMVVVESLRQAEYDNPVKVDNTAYNTIVDGRDIDQEQLVEYEYDDNGNLVQATTRGGLTQSFMWGHGGRFPIARITNLTYDQISSLESQARNIYFMRGGNLPGYITQIKTLFSNYINNPHYQVDLYTYEEGRGITSHTDPSGKTSFFEYDSANRLEQIKDRDGNILEEYTYHYKN